jgi:hypothetical protein
LKSAWSGYTLCINWTSRFHAAFCDHGFTLSKVVFLGNTQEVWTICEFVKKLSTCWGFV